MRHYIEHLLVAFLGAITLLAIYAAAKYVVPEVFGWLKYVAVVLVPFVFALIMSILLDPIIEIIQRYTKISKSFAVLLGMLLVFGGLSFFITMLIIHLVAELIDLSATLPHYIVTLQDYLKGLITQGKVFYLTLPKQVTSQMEQALNLDLLISSMGGTLQDWASTLANTLLTLISGLPGALIIIMISIVATYFISRDRRELVRLWIKLLPSPWGERSVEISRQVSQAFMAYIKAQLILVLITSTISILGLLIIGTKYAITIGLIVGFFDLLPLLGPGTVYIPWAIVVFITGSSGLGFKLLGLYLLVMVTRSLLEAKVIASNLGLHPLAVLLAMYIGFKTIGVIGLILGPIAIIVVQAIFKATKDVWRVN